MKKNCKVLLLTLITLSAVPLALTARAPLNVLLPYDSNFKFTRWEDQKFSMTQIGVVGASTQAWNGAGDKVNAANYLTADQNALAMLKGFPVGSEQADLILLCNPGGGDDGVIGHFKVSADFNSTLSYLVGFRFCINDNFWVGAFLPFYKMHLKNVVWTDQTTVFTVDGVNTKANITNALAANVAHLGNGLLLTGWDKAGQGDLAFAAGWVGEFVQYKPWIKKVTTSVTGALLAPTGVKSNPDVMMSMPFGNEGATAITIGGEIKVNFKHWVDAGVNVEFMHIFNDTRQRRIKVNTDQTDFLLLTKTEVQTDYGLTQKFNLFCESKLFKGISLKLAYQHVKQGSQELYVLSNDYSSTIANTAESLKEWTTHNAIVQLNWDTATADSNKYRPQFTVFYQKPFNGRRSLQTTSFGIGMVLNF